MMRLVIALHYEYKRVHKKWYFYNNYFLFAVIDTKNIISV
jgi:hypothetical protein